jgi:hypothetical protein
MGTGMVGHLTLYYWWRSSNSGFMDKIVIMTEIQKARILALRSALKLEIVGMKRGKAPSAYSILKKEMGFKGGREKVLAQINGYIAENILHFYLLAGDAVEEAEYLSLEEQEAEQI